MPSYKDYKDQMTEEEYSNLVKEKLENNHIWLNAFSCISPTDEFKIQIADMVLTKLNDSHALLPSSGITDENKTIRELAQLTPILYLRVNKS